MLIRLRDLSVASAEEAKSYAARLAELRRRDRELLSMEGPWLSRQLVEVNELRQACIVTAMGNPTLLKAYLEDAVADLQEGKKYVVERRLFPSVHPFQSRRAKNSGTWKLHLRVHEDSYMELAVGLLPVLGSYYERYGIYFKLAGDIRSHSSDNRDITQAGKFITVYVPKRHQTLIAGIVRDVDEVASALDLISMYDHLSGTYVGRFPYHPGRDWIILGSTRVVTIRWSSDITGKDRRLDHMERGNPVHFLKYDVRLDGTYYTNILNRSRVASLAYIRRAIEAFESRGLVSGFDIESHLMGLKDVQGYVAIVRVGEGEYSAVRISGVEQQTISGLVVAGNQAGFEVEVPIAAVSASPFGVAQTHRLLG